jgi:hypothetical protein
VVRNLDARGDVAATYHLGDLVGYAPWPNETVALLQSRGILGVVGNYDSTTANNYKHCGCKYENPTQEALTHQSFEWTKAHVNEDTRRYLASLPFQLDLRPMGGHLAAGPRIVLVHGTPIVNTQYWTEDRPDSFCLQMRSTRGSRRAMRSPSATRINSGITRSKAFTSSIAGLRGARRMEINGQLCPVGDRRSRRDHDGIRACRVRRRASRAGHPGERIAQRTRRIPRDRWKVPWAGAADPAQ